MPLNIGAASGFTFTEKLFVALKSGVPLSATLTCKRFVVVFARDTSGRQVIDPSRTIA